jgi:hypothetical protein
MTKPTEKDRLSFIGKDDKTITITGETRLADVAVKLVLAGEAGISANDFDKGVRLGGLIHILDNKGMPITMTRERVATDPFGAYRAVYRTTAQAIDKVSA